VRAILINRNSVASFAFDRIRAMFADRFALESLSTTEVFEQILPKG
jgi:hypothetical protein